MSGRKILVCKECGAMCDHDEINHQNICFDCENVFCELGDEDNADSESRI